MRSFVIIFFPNIELKSSVHKIAFMYALCNRMEDPFKVIEYQKNKTKFEK